MKEIDKALERDLINILKEHRFKLCTTNEEILSHIRHYYKKMRIIK